METEEQRKARIRTNWKRHYYSPKGQDYARNRKRDKDRDSRTGKEYYYKILYGITLSDKARLLAEQGGVCAICREVPKTERQTHTDHDHRTGKIRGILCSKCNWALGLFKDSPEILFTAARYLEKNKCQTAL